MQHDGDDQADACRGQGGAVGELAQPDRVVVERLRAEIELQVAHHVSEDETEQDHAGHGHDDLLADRGAPEAALGSHATSATPGLLL